MEILAATTKFISDYPKFILIIIVVLIILVIWNYLKNVRIMSQFNPKKKSKKKTDESDETSPTIEKKTEENKSEKEVRDPAIEQLIKDINQNS